MTFLEETFSASTAPPEHRFHQKAAQAVLKALLPETGTDIKGQMRSRQELLEASGYAEPPQGLRRPDPHPRPRASPDHAHRPGRFLERRSADASPSGQYYQLTHDYLVHSLRDWLTRKQRETRRGRAELRLAERSALVERQAREPPPAIRPGMGEHPAADEEEGLDRAATQDDEAGGAGAWSEDAGIGHAGLLDHLGRDRGLWQHCGLRLWWSRLQTADTPDVPAIVKQLSGYRRWADPPLVACWYKVPMITVGNICTPASPSSPSMPPRLITSSTAFSQPLQANFPCCVMP